MYSQQTTHTRPSESQVRALRQLVRDYRDLFERCTASWTLPVKAINDLRLRAEELLG